MSKENNHIEKKYFRSGISAAYFFLAPAMISIFVFFFIPVIAAFIISFTDFDIYSLGNYSNLRFIGLKNYSDLLSNELFWTSLKNTFYFVIVASPLSIAVSLGAALILNSKLVKLKSIFRLAYFIPVVTTLVAVAIVWRFIYPPRFGMLNYLLSFIGINPIDWLGDPFWAMPSIILMSIWKNFGYNMIIFIAGLQNIPEQLYEAAILEGADAWQQFKKITLPMLAPTTIFISIITMIGNFQLFAEPYVMTQGGPLNKTLSVVQYMYQEGFRWWNMGYSASIAFVLFIIIFAGTILQLKSLFSRLNVARNLFNSLVLSILVTIISLFFNSMAGYVFAKYRFAGRDKLFSLLLSSMIIPAQVTMPPLFLMLKEMGFINTYMAIIIPGLANIFGIFLIRQYALSIPDSLIESARMEGAPDFQIYKSIILPLCLPILITLAIFTFMGTWNDFLWPLIALTDNSMYTLPVALANLMGEHTKDPELMMAGSVITIIPILIVFLVF